MIKDFFTNLRRHKIMLALIIVLSVICWQLFIRNYSFQLPVVSKHQPSYNELLGSLAGCQSAAAISANDAQMQANNPDLYK